MKLSIFNTYKASQTDGGFTLIETLIALAVSSIVLITLGNFFISTNRTNTIQEKVAGTQQSVRAGLEIMARDIRMAGLDPTGGAGSAGFVNNGGGDETDADSIAIVYDHNGDGTNEIDVCYRYDSTDEKIEFRNGTGSTFQPLTEEGSISSMSFNYTLADGTTESDPTTSGELGEIRVVTVNICGKISGSYSDEHTDTYCFDTTIRPRNM